MSTENLALADRIEAKHCNASDQPAGYCDYCQEHECDAILAARALRESAQREADATERASTAEKALAVKVAALGETLLGCYGNHKIPLRLCPDKECPICEAHGALATAKAEGFQSGVEACIQEARATAERFRAAGNGEGASDGAPESFYVESMRHAYGAECAAQAIREALLPPPTGAAMETHEFVPCHENCDAAGDVPHTDSCCAQQCYGTARDRSHPIHGGR